MSSYIHSWFWCKPEYQKAGDFLRNRLLNKSADATSGKTIWKTRHKEVELLEVPSEIGNYRVAIKNYHERRFWRYFFRPSLAAREAIGYQILGQLNIPCAEVLLYGEERHGIYLTQAYFVTRFEENTIAMLDLRKQLIQNRQLVLNILRECVIEMAKLHRAGYRHGGAHPRNYLVRLQDDQSQLIWIDVATIKKYNWWNRKASIALDMTDMLEKFSLSQDELDQLCAEYRKIFDIPIKFIAKYVESEKFNIAAF